MVRGPGSAREFDSAPTADTNSIGELLEFKFSEDSVDDLYIDSAGLVTSFGIFGSPGSGKTVLMMYLLEQVLAHSRNDLEKRFGALILDPKAALIDDVTAAVTRAGRLDDLVVVNTEMLNSSRVKRASSTS